MNLRIWAKSPNFQYDSRSDLWKCIFTSSSGFSFRREESLLNTAWRKWMQMNLQKVQGCSVQSSYIQSLEFASSSNLHVELKLLPWLNPIIPATHHQVMVQEKLCTDLVLITDFPVILCRKAHSVFIWTQLFYWTPEYNRFCFLVCLFFLGKTIK